MKSTKCDDYPNYVINRGYTYQRVDKNTYKKNNYIVLKEGPFWFWMLDERGDFYHWCYIKAYNTGKSNIAPDGYCKNCDVELASGWKLALTIGAISK